MNCQLPQLIHKGLLIHGWFNTKIRLIEFRVYWAKGTEKTENGLCHRETATLHLPHSGDKLLLLFLFIPHIKQISWKTFWLSSHPLGKATCLLSQSAVSLRFTARWTALMARRWRSAQLSSFQASSHEDELLALLPPGGCCRHIACPWKYCFPGVQIIELCRAPYLLLSPQITWSTDCVQAWGGGSQEKQAGKETEYEKLCKPCQVWMVSQEQRGVIEEF